MSVRVLVTGATGFTGSYVVPLLLQQNYRVTCLVRAQSVTTSLPVNEIELVVGDLNDRDSLVAAFRGADALVNVASLGFGHAPNVVEAALNAGIRRNIFVSTTAVTTTLNASSKRVRLAAEETIRQSGLAYTILRPTMIFGSSRDRNISRLIQYLNRWPVVPVVGAGEHLQQPVYVGDVASAIVQALGCDTAIGKIYSISGKAAVTYNELIDTICSLLERKVRKVYIPATPVLSVLRLLEAFSVKLPIKAEQIERLNEDKAFDYTPAQQDFGYQPISLLAALQLQLGEMRLTE